MSKYTVILIPGDGIGPEVTAAARRVIDAVGVPIEWEVKEAGSDVLYKYGTPLPDETIAAIRQNKVALKGPITTPVGKGFRSVNVQIRKALDLFVNFRPAKSIPSIETRYDDVDLIVVRENTEGLYSGIEHVVVPGVVESLKIITETGSERVARFTFELARRHGRKRVTVVHKANIMKLSDGLFLEVCRRIAREYPDIQYDEAIVDATAMQLVLDPHQFDVLLMENLYGDILSDLASGLIGGLGLAPSANIGAECAVFEAVHGSAPDIAGQNIANPTALILSGVLLLRHLGETQAADRIYRATVHTLASVRTRDLGGSASTTEFTDAVLQAVDTKENQTL